MYGWINLVFPFMNPFCPIGVALPTEEYTAISLAGKVKGWCSPASSISPFQSADTSRRTQKAEMFPQNILPASMPLSLPLSADPRKVCSSNLQQWQWVLLMTEVQHTPKPQQNPLKLPAAVSQHNTQETRTAHEPGAGPILPALWA